MRVLCYLLCAVFLAPFVALAVTALGTLDLSQWWLHAVELKSVVRSLLAGLAAGLLAAALGVALAYQVCFQRFAGRRLVERLLVLPLLFPPFVLAAVYRNLFSPSGPLVRAGWLPGALAFDFESTAGFGLVMTVGLFPYVYLLARISFQAHGRAFVELGQTLGFSFSRSFWRILLPLSLPALLLGAGLVFIETAGEWAAASVLSVDTAATTIHQLWFARGAPHLASQLSFLFVAVVLVALVPAVRWTRRLHARFLTAVPGSALGGEPQSSSGRWRHARLLFCLLPILFGFVIPLTAVLVFVGQSIDVIDLSSLFCDSLSTIELLAAVSSVCLAFAIALSASQRASSSALTGWAVRWFTISLVIPASIVAVGSLILSGALVGTGQRYGEFASFLILALTLSARFVCFLLVPLIVGRLFLAQLSDEAGASLGLDGTRTFFRLQLGRIRGFLLLGVLLLAVQILRETAISVVLQPFGFQTLVLKTYGLIRIDMLPRSSAWILANALLVLYPLLTIEGLLSRRVSSRS